MLSEKFLGVKTAAIVAAVISLTGVVYAHDNSAKFSPDLMTAIRATRAAATSKHTAKVRVIVRYARPLTKTSYNRVASHVASMGRTFSDLQTTVLEVTPQELDALAQEGIVASVSSDRALSASSDTTPDANRTAIGANIATSQLTDSDATVNGAGIGVAVIDSGVAPVADLKGRIAVFKDFVNGRTDAYDDYGHGTHVAGIILGNGKSSSGSSATVNYTGVAPKAKLIALKALDQNGGGHVSDVLKALDWVVDNKDKYNIRVVNMSLSAGVYESYKTDPLCQAVERVVDSGIVVVVSAGNVGGGYGAVGAPGNDPAVITVGASNTRQTVDRGDDIITTYSSRGPSRFDWAIKPDLLAPGNKIVSLRAPGSYLDTTYPEARVATSVYTNTGDANDTENTAYTTLSGTSQAAPFVAGTAALLLDVNPRLTPNGVKAALMYSAQLLKGYDPVLKDTVVYDPLTQGAGEVNVPGAVQMASIMNRRLGWKSAPAFSTTIGGSSFVWSALTIPAMLQSPIQSGTLADQVTWGGKLNSDQVTWGGKLWADQVTWGGKLSADQVTWGGKLWADQVTWGGKLNSDQVTWGGKLWADQVTWGGKLNADQVTWGGKIWSDQITWGGKLGVDADQVTWGGKLWADQVTWGGKLNADQVTWGGKLWADQVTWGGKLFADQVTWGGKLWSDTLGWGGGNGVNGNTLGWGGGNGVNGDTLGWGGGNKGDVIANTLGWGGGNGIVTPDPDSDTGG